MNAEPKKKLCWNCEGRVAFSDENCSFCGVYLSPSHMDSEEEGDLPHEPVYESLSNSTEEVKDSSFLEESLNSHRDNGLLPFSLLLLGSIFLVFGLILFTFARQGTLTLQWDATYWYIYLAAATLFLIIGWRALQNLKN
jgi:hypothetical protein